MNAESEYGSSFFNNLSLDLKTIIPAAKCFSPTNLRYMKRFYELVSDASEKLPQIGAESRASAEIIPALSSPDKLPQVGAELLSINAILKVDTERPKNDGRESKWKLLRCKGRIHFERRSATTWMTRICPRRFMNGSHISDHHEIILDGSSSEGFDFYGRGVC